MFQLLQGMVFIRWRSLDSFLRPEYYSDRDDADIVIITYLSFKISYLFNDAILKFIVSFNFVTLFIEEQVTRKKWVPDFFLLNLSFPAP